MLQRLKAWWHDLWHEPRERMARCGAELAEVLDYVERSGALCTVAGRRPKAVIKLVRRLAIIEQELRRDERA